MGAGSDSTGEDLVAGRTNRAEERTYFVADCAPGEPNYNGPAILMVEVAKDLDNSEWDESDYDDDSKAWIPINQINGIMATGWSGRGPGILGGTGAIGRGGFSEGTGVQGLGGGVPLKNPDDPHSDHGAGGIGVHGLGGSQLVAFGDPNVAPGAGLVGQGGRQSQIANTLRLPHAAGVIGIGGGSGISFDALPSHPLMETGGVGVYGQGAELTTSMVLPPTPPGEPDPTTTVPSGPLEPGVGVVGRGGVAVAPEAGIAAGVVGLAGGFALPSANTTGGAGVFGQGSLGVSGIGTLIGVKGVSNATVGVQGETDTGNGVLGTASKGGRGGWFQSVDSAQLRLLPHSIKIPKPDSKLATPTELSGTGIPLALPKAGASGDLLAIDGVTQATSDAPVVTTCTLWLCVRSADSKTSTPAVWSQILTGAFVIGQS